MMKREAFYKSLFLMSLVLPGSAALADAGFIFDFSNGDVINDGSLITSIDGDATGYSNVTVYTESNFRMVVSPEDTSVTIGDYYGVKEGVIHGHWKAAGGNMERLYFSRESGEAFDLNYYVLTTNSEYGGAPATGVEDTYIIASKDGITESFRAKLPSEDWGINKVREIYLGPEFDDIKAFWFYSEGGTCLFWHGQILCRPRSTCAKYAGRYRGRLRYG